MRSLYTKITDSLIRFARPDLFYARADFEARLKHLEAFTEADLVRMHLSGRDISDLEPTDNRTAAQIFIEEYEKEDELNNALDEMKEIATNEFLKKLLHIIVRISLAEAACLSTHMGEVNLNRGVVNGIAALEDNLSSLKTVWDERHEPPEDFDKHEVV